VEKPVVKKCQSCGKAPAKHHIKKWENNVEFDLALCDACAEAKGFAPAAAKKGGLAEALGDMLEGLEGVSEGAVGGVECSHCGLLYSTFRQTGRLGCAHCYSAFEKQLKPLLRRVHGAVRHTGKAPAGDDEHSTRRQEIRRMQDEMERAVAREEFERAAELRDTIRRLSEEPAGPASTSGAAGAERSGSQ
jgi:protein arginine kinase activator